MSHRIAKTNKRKWPGTFRRLPPTFFRLASLLIAIAAFVVSIVSLLFAWQANDAARKMNDIEFSARLPMFDAILVTEPTDNETTITDKLIVTNGGGPFCEFRLTPEVYLTIYDRTVLYPNETTALSRLSWSYLDHAWGTYNGFTDTVPVLASPDSYHLSNTFWDSISRWFDDNIARRFNRGGYYSALDKSLFPILPVRGYLDAGQYSGQQQGTILTKYTTGNFSRLRNLMMALNQADVSGEQNPKYYAAVQIVAELYYRDFAGYPHWRFFSITPDGATLVDPTYSSDLYRSSSDYVQLLEDHGLSENILDVPASDLRRWLDAVYLQKAQNKLN